MYEKQFKMFQSRNSIYLRNHKSNDQEAVELINQSRMKSGFQINKI